MTREETKTLIIALGRLGIKESLTDEQLSIMRSYIQGATIQCRNKTLYDDAWCDCTPSWSFQSCDYRVKSDPVRPYTIYELTGVLHSRASNEINHKVTHQTNRITRLDFDDTKLALCIGSHEWITLEELANTFTWSDGTPCGKLVIPTDL